MKTRIRLLTVGGLLAAGLSTAPAQSADPAMTWPQSSDPAIARAVEKAKTTIKSLVGTLLPAVTAAVEAGGPPQGVTLCNLQANPLTRQVLEQADPAITAVKRTSLRVRNPANAPDAAEQAALERVAAIIADGKEPPPLVVQSLAATPDQPAEIRVYRSMTVAPNCLACHGDPAAFSPELRSALHAAYPDDAATGYAEGDWRGLIRVSVTAAQP